MWAKMAAIIYKKNNEIDNNSFQEGKILTGKYYMKNILPKTGYLTKKIIEGDKAAGSYDKMMISDFSYFYTLFSWFLASTWLLLGLSWLLLGPWGGSGPSGGPF